MSETAHHAARERRSIVPGVAGLVLALGAIALMYAGFINGLRAEELTYLALFLVGGGVAVIAAVVGIVGLVRGGHRILSSLTVLIALIPGVAILLLRFANS